MTKILLITNGFSKEFLSRSDPSTFIYTGTPTAKGNLGIEAIAPREGRPTRFLSKLRSVRLTQIRHLAQMLQQGLFWKPGERPEEIHCQGFVAGAVGVLFEKKVGVASKLVLYLDRNEITKYSTLTRRLLAGNLVHRSDCVVVENAEERRLLAETYGASGTLILTVGELLNDLGPVAGVYMHPERLAMLPYCKGQGIDVGCGSRKTHPNAIGVDIVAGGGAGSVGSERGRISGADICASGDSLQMFPDASLDYVIARHNLEHYVDVIKVLQEWKRVLRSGALLAMVLPDDEALDTVRLDASHKHAFTQDSFASLIDAVGGFKIRELGPCIPQWSFKCVVEKHAETSPDRPSVRQP